MSCCDISEVVNRVEIWKSIETENLLNDFLFPFQQNPTQGNIQRLTRANVPSSAAINGELMNKNSTSVQTKQAFLFPSSFLEPFLWVSFLPLQIRVQGISPDSILINQFSRYIATSSIKARDHISPNRPWISKQKRNANCCDARASCVHAWNSCAKRLRNRRKSRNGHEEHDYIVG